MTKSTIRRCSTRSSTVARTNWHASVVTSAVERDHADVAVIFGLDALD
jgi:hypothetical protein